MVKGMLSGTVKDKPSGMVKGTLPKSRGDAAGRVATAGPLAAPGWGFVYDGAFHIYRRAGTARGIRRSHRGESAPKELPPRVR